MSDQLEEPAIAGTWYLYVEERALTALITWHAVDGYRGTALTESGASAELDEISWNLSDGVWEFRCSSQGSWQWFRGTIVAGVFVGRCSDRLPEAIRPSLKAYRGHVTGWNRLKLAMKRVPRVYDIVLDSLTRACLRLDQDAHGRLLGSLKVVATRTRPDTAWDASGEGVEFDLTITHWDGAHLECYQQTPNGTYWYGGQAEGNTITGTAVLPDQARPLPWHGLQAEVLGYGLTLRSPTERQRWQEQTRQQLRHLMMADDPSPIAVTWQVLRDRVEPLIGMPEPPFSRDDAPLHWPPDYTKRELLITATLANPYGPSTIREIHAWLAIPPATQARREGYRVALVLNGHGSTQQGAGSWAMLDPTSSHYWYGDAFARRGFVVLAVDISHRPLEDRAHLYTDRTQGDDPLRGNGVKPAITSPAFPHDSSWEEDGERVWDVQQALDLLLSGQLGVLVDPQRVLITGLSMGGEIATLCGALDPRLSLVIPAAFSPDLRVLQSHGNHPCWRWQHADLLEYMSVSDWHALIAPRPLIVQTGQTDTTYSAFQPPFAGDKQVLRRSRAAYGQEKERVIHYLHTALPGEATHQYRVGDRLSTRPGALPVGITIPAVSMPRPDDPWSSTWQCDGQTTVPGLKAGQTPTLFAYIDYFWA